MFTVLIAEKEHIDAIQKENKLFFEPFLNSKELAFCYWNPAGQSLDEAVPELLGAIGRKKEWRAVIVNNTTAETINKRNPFDVADRSSLDCLTPPTRQPDLDAHLDEWEAEWKKYYEAVTVAKEAIYRNALEKPLQKLTSWLCFKPEEYIYNEIRDIQDEHDWAMEMLGRDQLKFSARLEAIERNQYRNELRMKEKIRREFLANTYLNIAYPTDVLCVSLRAAASTYFDPDDYWRIRLDNEYSKFADRNMYFDKMRFMVFDILPKTHRNFRTDYIRFLASLLVLISNPVPNSAMQARRLYRLETETDDAPLCTIVTSYDKKLAATYEAIENEKERIKSEIPAELTDKAVEKLFCTPSDVPVVMDSSCDVESLIPEKDYGLIFGGKENEYAKWNEECNNAKKVIAQVSKRQSRSVQKSAGQIRLAGEISDASVSRLTPNQIEDIRKYTNDEEDKMIASIPPDFTDSAVYMQRITEDGEKVKKAIRSRMSPKTGMLLGLLCIGLYLICFLPFIFANDTSSQTASTAITICVTALGFMAVTLLVAFIFMRASISDVVKGYNSTAQDVVNDIQGSMNKVSEYLSATYNVRRGHAVQNSAKNNIDQYTKSLRIRKKHQEDIRKRRAYLAEGYGDFIGDRTWCDETMSRPYEYDFDMITEYDYPAPFLAGDFRQVEFISSGNMVKVPSSYVTSILVRMEGIYE
ncbi:MAG: hypothetical protein IKU54_04250 [Oscillospiraceae bacterium]|nr:hypothetical protein [Oscillospiraceae bacterium]